MFENFTLTLQKYSQTSVAVGQKVGIAAASETK
jgi:hypothetical protein